MENLNDKIAELLNKAKLTDNEKQFLLNQLEGPQGEKIRDLLKQQFDAEMEQPTQLDSDVSKRMLLKIHAGIGVEKPISNALVIRRWFVRIAAACVVGILALAGYTLLRNQPKQGIVVTKKIDKPIKAVINPGSDKAILTLADGSTIVLNDKRDGSLANQGATDVIKVNGVIVYNSVKGSKATTLYNTITTPAGGQYQIELADGTRVWLNSGSSLYFPTAFTGKERRVEMKGEAYFEVQRNVSMPFKVKVNDAEIQVLGTHFNVMAYTDEAALKTTLLKGQVRFVSGNANTTLDPGQQSQLTKVGQLRTVNGIDVDEVVAWKNGMFDFEGADIVTVARQLSRWYDVEMTFDKKVSDLFYAKIPRNTDLKDVLKALELTGKVRFEIEGRKIKVRDYR